MRILIATPLLPSQSGGPAQYAVHLANAIEAKGHQVETLAFSDVARFPSGIRHLVLFFKACTRMSTTDAVIALDTLSIALPVTLAAALFRKHISIRAGGDFVWEHYVERTKEKILFSKFYNSSVSLSLKEKFALWLQRNIVIPLADVLVFSTEWQRQVWLLPYCLHNRRSAIIENAYRPYSATAVANNYSHTVAWIGRDIVLKNVDTLDRAVTQVKKDYPLLEYKKFSMIPHTEVTQILKSVRCLVIPSVSEISPNLALEALTVHVPVLLTKDCGLKDTLKNAVTWIDSLSVDDVADKISKIMTDTGYEEAVARAKNFTNARTYTDVAEEFLALLH